MASVTAIAVCLRSQLTHCVAPSTVDFTLRLSSCRFDDASTGEISIRNPGSNKPTKTMCFQAVERLAKGIGFEPITFRI